MELSSPSYFGSESPRQSKSDLEARPRILNKQAFQKADTFCPKSSLWKISRWSPGESERNSPDLDPSVWPYLSWPHRNRSQAKWYDRRCPETPGNRTNARFPQH